MNNFAELPLIEPMYSTYHSGIASAMFAKNPSVRNWYLNQVMILECEKRFLNGYTTPNISVIGSLIGSNPYIEWRIIPMILLKGCMNRIIRNLIDAGYYVYFDGIDDYYVQGKSRYKEKHIGHDGTICGYNQDEKTYCVYAYDSNWIFQKFWTPQKGLKDGMEAMFRRGKYGRLCGLKPKMDQVEFSAATALNGITKYLDSGMEATSEDDEGKVRGIVVHEYIAKYVGKLYDGSIPYERMDRRVFRLIWEHKKVMLERINLIEQALNIGDEISQKYKHLVAEADAMRMLYASHHMKRRDSVLPIIQKKLLLLMQEEEKLLTNLIEKARKVMDNESVEIPEK